MFPSPLRLVGCIEEYVVFVLYGLVICDGRICEAAGEALVEVYKECNSFVKLANMSVDSVADGGLASTIVCVPYYVPY